MLKQENPNKQFFSILWLTGFGEKMKKIFSVLDSSETYMSLKVLNYRLQKSNFHTSIMFLRVFIQILRISELVKIRVFSILIRFRLTNWAEIWYMTPLFIVIMKTEKKLRVWKNIFLKNFFRSWLDPIRWKNEKNIFYLKYFPNVYEFKGT